MSPMTRVCWAKLLNVKEKIYVSDALKVALNFTIKNKDPFNKSHTSHEFIEKMEAFISHWALTLLLICLIQLTYHPLQRNSIDHGQF